MFTPPQRRRPSNRIERAGAPRAASRCSSLLRTAPRCDSLRFSVARIQSLRSWLPSCSATCYWRPHQSQPGLLVEEIMLDYREVERLDEWLPKWLAAHRTETWTDLSWIGSEIAGGYVIPAVLGLVGARHGVHTPVADRSLCRLRRRRRVRDVPRDDAVHRSSASCTSSGSRGWTRPRAIHPAIRLRRSRCTAGSRCS